METDRAFWELPDGWQDYSEVQWASWHKARAKALGARYDSELADDHVTFFSCLKHITGEWAGKNFALLAWQEHQIVRPLFGYLKPDGMRLFITVFVAVPKKNGKSELAAGFALDLLLFDGEPGAEVYGAAKDREQAGIVYRTAAAMVEEVPELAALLETVPSTKRIIGPSHSFYRAVSSDTGGKHGYNSHGVIIDEEHAIDDREFVEVLTEGSGDARRQPVVVKITTAGYNRASICYEDWTYARDVRDGRIQDSTLLPVIYELEENEDWEDEANWYKSNPSLGHTIDIEKVRTAYHRAKETPARENAFRRLRLNQWTQQETRWLPMDRWDACGLTDEDGLAVTNLDTLGDERARMLKDLAGQRGYGWLDLSTKTDITTFGLVIPLPEGNVALLPWFFIPRDNLRERGERDAALYEQWAYHGFVELTDGNVTDYAYLRKRINEIRADFLFEEIAYDDWNAGKLEQELMEDGFTMVPTAQSIKALSPGTKELLALTLSGRAQHGGNPVLRYMADNLVVDMDSNERVRPTKAKSTGRIDGIVGCIMGLDRAMRDPGEPDDCIFDFDL